MVLAEAAAALVPQARVLRALVEVIALGARAVLEPRAQLDAPAVGQEIAAAVPLVVLCWLGSTGRGIGDPPR